jgi:mannitol/fructose-specific phosphotransferase system IIA component (Ntr-type)
MLNTILTEDLVVTNSNPKSWKDALKIAGNLLVKAGKVKPEFIDSMISVVNKYGPYMILVPKVCFFHGEPGPKVNEPCLSLCVFKEPVYFSEFKNQEIKCCFAFGAVDKDSHMQMLVEVTKLLQDKDFIQLVTNNGARSAILGKIQQY